MKLCKDCFWCSRPATIEAVCGHAKAQSQNPVTGLFDYRYALTMRQASGACGPGGELFDRLSFVEAEDRRPA